LTTCDYVTLVVTLLPGHGAVIVIVSNEHGVIVIHDETARAIELLKAILIPATTRNSDLLLRPTCIWCD
jgi:hypothetical protein